MLLAILALQTVILIAMIFTALRKSPAGPEPVDQRLEQLLAADLPSAMARSDVRGEALERHLRDELGQLRGENADTAARLHQAAANASSELRGEVIGNIDTLGKTLREGLDRFRTDNKAESEQLRTAVDAQLSGLTQRFSAFSTDTLTRHNEGQEALHSNLRALARDQAEQHDKLNANVAGNLKSLNEANTAKLEEMRQTVDEKLHATLQTRLTESFGQVTDQLTKVHAGLGEMSKLSAGMDDLSRIFTNVKSRGTIGEVLLETLLKQMLAANQYSKNVKVKPGSQEMVEFAIKLPTPNGETLLPIDSKFPREIGDRLETAYSTGVDIVSAGKAFETAIRNEGKKICEKYIAPPHTTAFAVMFLPTEGLYAEVMRRDGLQSDIQQHCRVTIAGPSTLSAILNSFQMGFHMLELQQKGDDVWKVLANARKEFGNFEKLMDKMTDDVGRVQGTIDKLGIRTRAINRTLRDVSLEPDEQASAGQLPSAFDGLLPMLAAGEEG